MLKSLSVFFPAYNEEGNIGRTVGKAIDVLKDLKLEWEILIIDDGSTDRTGEIVDELVRKHPGVRAIHQKNGGYGMALRSGFTQSRYEWIAYNDGDGQFDFSEVGKFLDKTDEYDLLLGYRIKRNDPFLRLVFAKGWKLMIFVFFGFYVRDVDCGFKMVKREVIEKVSPLQSTRGGMINAELAIKAKKSGFRIGQIGVHHFPRTSGKPTGASLNVIVISFKDLFTLWLNL